MLTKEDFKKQFASGSEEELLEALVSIESYSEEARQALREVIEERGGMENLDNLRLKKEKYHQETRRIAIETRKFIRAGSDISLVKKLVQSNVLAPVETETLIDDIYREILAEDEDVSIKPKTITGSLIGLAISVAVCGTLWTLFLQQTSRVFLLFIAGTAFFSYLIIRFFTRQSSNNAIVLLSTLLAVVLSMWIGHLFGNPN